MQVTVLIFEIVILAAIGRLATRPNMKAARELNAAALNLKGLLKGVNRETLDKLAQISTKVTRLDLSGTLLAVSLTSIGVAAGFIASLTNDWIDKGPGLAFWGATWNRHSAIRGLQVAGLALLVAVLFGAISVLMIKRHLNRVLPQTPQGIEEDGSLVSFNLELDTAIICAAQLGLATREQLAGVLKAKAESLETKQMNGST